jgi:hypothetical protein
MFQQRSSLSDTIKSATQGRGSSVLKVNVADQVREYAYTRHILPARDAQRKSVTVTSGEIHKALRLSSQVSRVCNALLARKFETVYKVRLVSTSGQIQGATATFTFEI